jgi:hypothetical protein
LDYRQVKGTNQQKEKLEKVLHTVEEEVRLIEQKKNNILTVEADLISLRDRAQKAIIRFEPGEK